MAREDRLGTALFLACFGTYLFTAYPGLAPRDAGDLALAALQLRVAHPPGYPLYSVLGHAWMLIFPFGTVAYRLNGLSSLAGAFMAYAFYAWCRRRLAALPAAGCAAALAAAAPVWKFSALGEKYTLQGLLITALLLTAEGERRSLHKRACLSGLLFGLAWINHQTAILAVPMLAWLWRAEARRHEISPASIFPAFLAWAAAGAGLSLFIWIRLGSLAEAWRVWTRADYGTFSLFSGFAKPLSEAADGLLLHLGGGLLRFGFGAGAALAAWSLLSASALEWSLVLGLLCFGPVFFLMTRFDAANWVARSALEPAFIVPLLLTAALAACALARLSLRRAAWLSALLAALSLVSSAPTASRRFELSAYDYLRDLRHALPPGSSAAVGGDTALFGLKLAQAEGKFQDRRFLSDLEPRAGQNAGFVTGISLDTLRSLGVAAESLRPAGLTQALDGASPSDPWEFSALRPDAAPGDSYAHDARLSYAFAHYLDGMIEKDPERSAWEQKWAVILDPEDYRPALQ